MACRNAAMGAGVTAGLAQAAIASPINIPMNPLSRTMAYVGMKGRYLMGLAACS